MDGWSGELMFSGALVCSNSNRLVGECRAWLLNDFWYFD